MKPTSRTLEREAVIGLHGHINRLVACKDTLEVEVWDMWDDGPPVEIAKLRPTDAREVARLLVQWADANEQLWPPDVR